MLSEPDTFGDICPMLSHYVKVLQWCCGRLITGSGLDDAVFEFETFGPTVINSMLAGSQYVRAFKGVQII